MKFYIKYYNFCLISSMIFWISSILIGGYYVYMVDPILGENCVILKYGMEMCDNYNMNSLQWVFSFLLFSVLLSWGILICLYREKQSFYNSLDSFFTSQSFSSVKELKN